MIMVRGLVVIVIAACQAGPPKPTAGSGSAVVTIARDAATADAMPGTDASVSLSAATLARLPTTPVMIAIATELSGITIARLDNSGLHVVFADDEVGNQSFGWIDAHTLVTSKYLFEDGTSVTRIVDGVIANTVTFPKTEWDDISTELRITERGDVFLRACETYLPDGNNCKVERMLRALPTKGTATHTAPAGIAKLRTAHAFTGAELWPRPPTVAMTQPITLALGKREERMRSVTCKSVDGEATYPDDNWDGSSGFVALSTRWVNAKPPIYELSGDYTDPVDFTSREHLYFRACTAKPFDNFAWFGAGLWAAYAPPPDLNNRDSRGTWVFYADDVAIGRVIGLDALRATTSVSASASGGDPSATARAQTRPR